MPAVTWEIPALTGGVSRQPTTQRHRNQSQTSTNMILDLARGAEQRAGSEYIDVAATTYGELNASSGTSTKYCTHWIDRDATNRFLVLIDDTLAAANRIQVFNALTGAKHTVNIDAAVAVYLTTGSPEAKDKFVLVSIADTTFILNKEMTTALDGTATTHNGNDGNALHNWTGTVSADHRATYKDFDFPPAGVGRKFFAEDDVPGFPAGYYETLSTTIEPYYKRIRTEEANYTLKADTMPVKMTWDGATTWTVSLVTWNDRLSGNSVSNPGPSFIGKKIKDMAFHDNRLWFCADEQIVSSQLGDFYNLWIDNVANFVDTDPIDVQLSGTSVNKIDFMVPFSKSLVIMASGARQFEIKSDGVLSPTTVNVIPSTSYQASGRCRPVTMGKQLYFVSEDSTRSQLWEYMYSDTYVLNIASDISMHVDDYIPTGVTKMISVEAKDMLFAHVRDSNEIIMYKSMWQQDQKVQSAFAKWSFDSDNDIVDIKLYDDYLYLLIRRSNLLWLEKVNISTPPDDSSMGYSVRLDRKMSLIGVYDSGTGITTWTLPMDDASITEIVLGSGFGDSKGLRITVDHDADPDVMTAAGDYGTYAAWVGRPYTASVQLSEQFYRDQNGKVVEGTLSIRRIRVRHRDTGFYSVLVTPLQRSQREYQFTPYKLDSISSLTNTVNIVSSGFFDCKPFVEAATGVITLENSSPIPSIWVSVTLDGIFVPSKSDPTV